MIFHTSVESQAAQAREYFERLVTDKKIVEIKRISPKRTHKQNAYLHLLIGAFGVHFGYTLEEAKLIYKEISKDIYAYDKKGRTFWRSSAELSREEMAKTIDRFREASARQGYDLPLATDQEWLHQIENAMEQAKNYL